MVSIRLTQVQTRHRFGEHVLSWRCCTRCDIGKIAHEHVFGRGTLPCDILFIGEAPGKTEDLLGYPFVGRAGKLLDSWIGHAQLEFFHVVEKLKLLPENERPSTTAFSFAITNTVLCRPCDGLGGPNRAPTEPEKANCSPRLAEFVKLASPKALVTLGAHARETISEWGDLPVLSIKHPSWYLRQGRGSLESSLEEAEKLAEFIMSEVLP